MDPTMRPVDGEGPILVVDDDPKIAHLVRMYLEREGFAVGVASDGREALAAARERPPRLIVLDLMLPELDGLSVARELRATSDVPILMLSARGSVAERIQGMSEGADDYLPKPFSPAELVIRVKAILRRAERTGDPSALPGGAAGTGAARVLRHLDLEVDVDRHEVRRGDVAIPLTAAEFRLLVTLIEADGRVLSRDALLDALHASDPVEILDRSIDVYVARLREKLGDSPSSPRYVATVRGFGYRLAR
jgi:DNA-binding response OmpR family regulator